MSAMQEMVDSSDLVNDAEALRARVQRDGYALVRQVIPVGDARQVSDALRDCLADIGLVRRGTDFEWSGMAHEDVAAEEILARIHSTVPLHLMWESSAVRALFGALVGEEPWVYPYSDVRTYPPGDRLFLNPAHQDAYYIGPNRDYFTAWTPLASISRATGGLAIADASHLAGRRRHTKRMDRRSHLPGHAPRGGIAESSIREPWVTTDYELGDVLVFTPFTVHQGAVNHSSRVRVSTDTRFQPASTPRTRLSQVTAAEILAAGKTPR